MTVVLLKMKLVTSQPTKTFWHCDCTLTRKRQETGGRSCHTALIPNKSLDFDAKDQVKEVGTDVSIGKQGSIDQNYLFSDLIEVDMPSKYKDVPRVQAEVLSGAYVDRGTEPLINITDQERIALEQVVSNLTKPYISKHRLKIIIPNDKGEVEHEYTEITATSSGSMAMALDEKMIKKIRNLTDKNRVLLGVLRKTFSGHYALEFNKSATSSNVSRQVVVNKTNSGNIIMEVHKDIIKNIHPGPMQSKGTRISSTSIGVTTRKEKSKCNKCFDTGHVQAEHKTGVEERKGKYNIMRHCFKYSMDPYRKCDYISQQKCCASAGKILSKKTLRNILATEQEQGTPRSHNIDKNKQYPTNTYNDLKDEFQDMIEKGNTSIYVTIVSGNGFKSIIKAEITKTQSRHIAVDVKEVENIGQIANRLKDYPVSIIKTKSRYLLQLNQNSEYANAIFRRNSTGEMLVVLKDPILKYPGNMPAVLETKDAVYIARVRGFQNGDSDELPLFLKATTSGNFAFVLDKEFEHTFKQTVNRFGVDECPVKLSRTQSGAFIVDLSTCDIEKNGLLVKSGSGNIRVFADNASPIYESQMYRSTIQSDEFHSKRLKTKSCSDSLLYSKVKTCSQKICICDSAAILKKTEPGKYAVVLNEYSKVSFLNNVKKYVSNTGKSLIPIKVTKDGDLIICLCNDHDGLYGSVKITPSGNINVLIDENVIKNIGKERVKAALKGRSSESVYFIGSLVDPCTTAVTACCLMPSGRCYGEKQYDYEQFTPQTSYYGYMSAKQSPTGSYKHCYANLRNSQGSEDGYPSDVSPPISILRTTHPKLTSHSEFKQQTYYVIDPVPPIYYRKELTNEDNPYAHFDVDFHGKTKRFCCEVDIKNSDKETYRPDLSCLDYLDSMPPQLPQFLRDDRYR